MTPIFFMATTSMAKFHATQAFHGLTEYFVIAKRTAARRNLFATVPFLFPFERENFHTQECDRHAEGGGNQVAGHGREAQPVVENDHDDVLDDIVRDIRYGKADEPVPRQRLREHEGAVQPVGDGVGRDIAEIERDIRVRHGEPVQPCEERAVQGVYAADDEEQQKFPREKMAADFLQDSHGKTPSVFGRVYYRRRVAICQFSATTQTIWSTQKRKTS